MNKTVWRAYKSGLPQVTEADLVALEATIGHGLPADYREAVQAHAGMITERVVVKFEYGDTPLGPLFFISQDPDYGYHIYNVWKVLDDLHDWGGELTEKDLIPFSSNTASGLFCFDYRIRPDAPEVVFVDKNYDPDDPTAIQKVADSFSDLLANLV